MPTFKLNSRVILLAGAAAIFVLTLTQSPVHAQAVGTNEAISSTSAKLLAAGVAFALGAMGAGYGVGHAGAASMAALAEKPEVRSMALIITALAEAIAIYGLVMAIIILGQAT